MGDKQFPQKWQFESTIVFDQPQVTSSSDQAQNSSYLLSTGSFALDAKLSSVKAELQSPTKGIVSPTNSVGFSFVNVGHPNDAKQKTSKRAIRSHVAKVQHSRARESGSRSTKSKQQSVGRSTHPRRVEPKPSPQDAQTQVPPPLPQEPSTESSNASSHEDLSDVTADGTLDSTPTSDPQADVRIDRQDSHATGSQVDDDYFNSEGMVSLDNVNTPRERDVFLYRLLQGGRNDPFWTYPAPHESILEPLLDHYLVHVVIDMPFVSPTDASPDFLKRKWWPLAMTDPAIFWAIALGAAASYKHSFSDRHHKINLMTFKQKAIQHINEALADPVRSVSDATLGAVMKMAAYEAIWGEVESYTAHMGGLQQLVNLRGGLANLGLDGLLERLVLWVDSNASHQIGCGWKFDKKWFPTIVEHPPADPKHFARMSPCGSGADGEL